MTTVGAAQVDPVSNLGDEATVVVDHADDGRFLIAVVVRGAQFPGATRQVSFSLVFTGEQVDHLVDAVVKAREGLQAKGARP